jgi:hypothetical protein
MIAIRLCIHRRRAVKPLVWTVVVVGLNIHKVKGLVFGLLGYEMSSPRSKTLQLSARHSRVVESTQQVLTKALFNPSPDSQRHHFLKDWVPCIIKEPLQIKSNSEKAVYTLFVPSILGADDTPLLPAAAMASPRIKNIHDRTYRNTLWSISRGFPPLAGFNTTLTD